MMPVKGGAVETRAPDPISWQCAQGEKTSANVSGGGMWGGSANAAGMAADPRQGVGDPAARHNTPEVAATTSTAATTFITEIFTAARAP
jgi:hypothetical protein